MDTLRRAHVLHPLLTGGTHMRNLLILALFTFCIGVAAENLSDADIDAGVEDVISDSEGAKAEARASRQRVIDERRAVQQARRQNEKAQNDAIARREQANAVLIKTEKEIAALKIISAKLKKNIDQHNRNIAWSDKTIQNSNAKLEKAKADVQTLKTLRDEKLVKLDNLAKQHRDMAQEKSASQQQINQASLEFQQSQQDEKLSLEKLEKNKLEYTQRRPMIAARVARLRQQYIETRNRTSAIENEIVQYTQKTQRLEEEMRMAETEVQKGEMRMREAQERLNEARVRHEQKENVVNQKRKVANQNSSKPRM